MSPVGGQGAEWKVKVSSEGMRTMMAAFDKFDKKLQQVGHTSKRTAKSGTELGRSFRNIALRTAAIVGIVRSVDLITRSIRGAVGAGIEYNQVIEQSTLAIASLITAQGKIFTVTGEQLEGIEKLDAAYELATEQVKKLRIAGIQTAATTKELVDAFQQAVGAGLATGLTLDEIRKITIRIAQAAGALGVPYRQLNEEIRSILGGIIDQNTRIAKSLQITNEQIRAAKEQNRLADFLLDRFKAFETAGERIVKTWSALKSNLEETFQLFAGEATKPLFEALKGAGLDALSKVFDLDTAEITDDFKVLLRELSGIFDEIGIRLTAAIEGAVDGAISLGDWLAANRDIVNETVDAVFHMADGFKELVVSMGKITTATGKWLTKSETAASHFDTIGDVLKTIANSPILTGGIAVGGVVAIVTLLVALFGSWAVAILGVTTAIGGLVTWLDHLYTSTAEAIEAQVRLEGVLADDQIALGEQAVAAAKLTREYLSLSERLDKAALTAEEAQAAQARLLEIEKELIAISPAYQTHLDAVTEKEMERAKAIEFGTLMIRQGFADQIERTRLLLAEAEAAEQLRAKTQVSSLPFFDRVRIGLMSKLGFRQTDAELEAQRAAIVEYTRDLARLQTQLEAFDKIYFGQETILGGGTPDDDDSALKGARAQALIEDARIKAVLAIISAELKAKLDDNLITYQDYYDRLNEIQQLAYDQQIAAQRKLLAEETDLQKRAQIEAKIIRMRSQSTVALLKNLTALDKAKQKFDDDFTKLNVRLLTAMGQAGEAARQKLVLEFRDTLRILRLDAEANAERINLIEDIIDVETAKTELKLLEEEVARARQRMAARLGEIDIWVSTGQIRADEARPLMAQAYEELRTVIQALIPEMLLLSQTIQNPQDAAKVQQMIDLVRELDLTIEDLNDRWKDFKDQVKQGSEDALARYFTDAVESAEDLGDAFTNLVGSIDSLRNLLGSLVMVIVEATARMIAMRIVAAAFGGLGLSGGGEVVVEAKTGGHVRKYAPGGRVSGPGGPRSDMVPAMLSDGEFVIQARSVQKYGAGFFSRLNQGLIPRDVRDLKRYATGGIVGTSGLTAETRRGTDLKGELTLGLGDGLVVEHMGSSAGERLVLKIINKNRRGIRSSLGI